MSSHMPFNPVDDYNIKVQQAKTFLGFSPTADVEEVVRCKECKEKLIQPDGTIRCRLSGRTKSAGDYCSSADKIVYCKDCKNLMFSDCYGECAESHKGIVQPDDYCIYGEWREE